MRVVPSRRQVAFSHRGGPPASQADSRLNLDVPDWHETQTLGSSQLSPEPGPGRAGCPGWARPTCPKASGRSRSTTTPASACLPPLKSLWAEPELPSEWTDWL